MNVSPTDKAVVESIYIRDLNVTFVESNTQSQLISNVPLNLFNFKGDHLFINKIIDLQRSYIDLSAVNFVNLQGKSLYLVFWYDEPAVWGFVGADDKTSIQPFEIKLNGLKTYFPENRNLYNKRYSNILLSFPALLPSGNAGLNEVYATNKFLTLSRKGLQFFYRIPLKLLYQTAYNFQYRLQNITFDFQASYIESTTNTVNDLNSVFFNAIIDETSSLRR